MGIKGNKYFTFGGKKYCINLNKLKEICNTSPGETGNNELEISQAYETDDNGELRLSSKVEHETKTFGNAQQDVIVYDFVKLLILSLLEYEGGEEIDELGMVVTMNTLIHWGILEVIE